MEKKKKEKTEKKGLSRSLIGKSYNDPFVEGEDIDVVSGATYTSQAIIRSARVGSNKLARYQLHMDVSFVLLIQIVYHAHGAAWCIKQLNGQN